MIDLAPQNPYGLALKSPVLTAAGCFGYGVEYARMVDLNQIGAITTRSTTLHGRRVAQPPRLLETPAGVLAVGYWPDPGIARVIERYAPVWAGWNAPVVLSITGTNIADFTDAVAALAGVDGIAGVELNLLAHAAQAVKITMASRAATQLPLIAKLAAISSDIAVLANAVANAGADAITLSASTRGMTIDPHSGELVSGWLSGPAVRPMALALVAELAQTATLPIIACGGVASIQDAQALLAAGAAAVQVGTALLDDPNIAGRISSALANTYLTR